MYNDNNRDYPASRTYSRGSNYQRDEYRKPKKRSGAKFTAESKGSGKPCVHGWKYSRVHKGLLSFIAAPYYGTQERTSESGKCWQNWIMSVTHPDGEKKIYPCLFDCENHKVYVKQMNWIANPKANNGGYFGKHISKDYR